MKLSDKAINLLEAVFYGDLRLPVSAAEEVVEIKRWIKLQKEKK